VAPRAIVSSGEFVVNSRLTGTSHLVGSMDILSCTVQNHHGNGTTLIM
jgi:hypothetical protein